ncbi:hypothetical protein OG978_06980 [Streptomyces sp. NBC_01591]|uniref:hypothetical protein n=1 Tax=Streptomyces sp. NBC_01591 TaxID=2975888 RepID=UPI002DDAE643|nr:hypothetical protein [Streptomyces sp. NBC_01591]WSD67149.1 hypothetical protein OG978_06980 [Streptomyces sp. NBC_01591]
MSERYEQEPQGASLTAVITVLTPVLTGTAAILMLVVGLLLEMAGAANSVGQSLVTVGWIFGAITAAAVLLAGISLLVTALRNGSEPAVDTSRRAPRRPVANGTMGIASFIAGPSRSHLREEWASVLAGDPDDGLVLSSRRSTLYALGFVWAALRLRVRDLMTPLWLPADWILSTASRSQSLIAAVVGAQAIYIVGHGGISALVTEIWEPCGILGGGLYVLMRWLRRIRGIELASAHSDSPPE